MKVVRTINEFRAIRKKLVQNASNSLVGFVPTMGYLHKGHLSLANQAKKDCGVVAASIFVNPKQFGPNEDLAKYPRNLERDIEMLESEGVDVLFYPKVSEMYPPSYGTQVTMDSLERTTREGLSRPGHFTGVATVVSKLFNIVQPDKAYFGQKDGVQCIAVKKLVRDLNFNLDVVICPTLRESDGLAMSSRNSYLNADQRKIATTLYKALSHAQSQYKERKVHTIEELIAAAVDIIKQEPKVRLDYIIVSDIETGEDIQDVKRPIGNGELMISGAIFNGTTRLIDNLILSPSK